MTGPPAGRTLVTGASGTVGRFVVAALRDRGQVVRAAVQDPARHEDADAIRFDFTDAGTWAPALAGVDRVFLMRPPAVADVRAVIAPFVERLPDAGVRHVVVLSVLGVNPALPHWQLERAVRRPGSAGSTSAAGSVTWTMLRPAFFMQNLETAYRVDVRDRDRIRLPAGRGRTSFIDTRDVAAAATACLLDPAGHAGRAYSLTGSVALSWSEVAALLSAELGRPIVYQDVSLRTMRRELRVQGQPPAYVNVQTVIQLVARLGLAAKVTEDLPTLLGRPAGTMAAYLHVQRDCWIPEGHASPTDSRENDG